MLLDPETCELSPGVYDVLEETRGRALPGRLKTELFASVVEITTEICRTAHEALDALRSLRAATAEAAVGRGLRIAAAGSHPTSPPALQEIAVEERYQSFVEYAGISARRQGVSGLHVHVGMPDGETCYRVLEALLPWLPAILAVSANSPYLCGAETGLFSCRAEVLATLPRSGAPPAVGSYEGWKGFVERLQRAGLPLTDDYRSFWWDIRPHPMYGTLEIRMPDQPTSVERSAALAALLRNACAFFAANDAPPVDPARRADYVQNRWAAARFGPRALLLHPDGERMASAEELVVELVELTGAIDGLDAATCEAERQLEVGRARGLGAAAADLIARSVP